MLQTVLFYTKASPIDQLNRMLQNDLVALSEELSSQNISFFQLVTTMSQTKRQDIDTVPATSEAHKSQGTQLYNACKESLMDYVKQNSTQYHYCLLITDSKEMISAANLLQIPVVGLTDNLDNIDTLQGTSYVVESMHDIDPQFLKIAFHRARKEPVTIGTTNRLYLRELTLEDIPTLYTMCQSTKIKRFVHDMELPLSSVIELHGAYIRTVYQFYDYGFWGIFLRESNRLIGRCGLQNIIIDSMPEIELGYLLDETYWGYGYAKESIELTLHYAFHYLCLPRVVAVIEPENTNSLNTAQSIGMNYDHDILRDNKVCFLYILTVERFIKTNNKSIY